MNRKYSKRVAVVLACGAVILGVSSCSKEKAKEDAAAPVADTAPAVSMKEPGEVAVPPAAAGAVSVRARFDGYAARVAKGLWQPVPLTTEVANFALITPMAAISAASGLVVEGGPEGLAVGTPAGTLQTVDGRPLLVGREYAFAFSKGAEVWAVEITAVP